ncbi:hypothetical protein VU08_03550 [Desulfobulbus sp. F5]|nr:hypothetical protein [Desulfobulbus sp. F5]
MKNSTLKWILGILGTIVLGAIGSGLWSLLLEPISVWAGRTLFTIATLGLEALRTNVYVAVAKGLHEEASLAILLFLIFVSLGILGYYSGRMHGRRHAEREIASIVAKIKSDTLDEKDRRNRIQKELVERKDKIYAETSISTTLGLICIIVFCNFQLFILFYTNSAITHFRQCYSICEPFITEQQAKEFRSQFALVESRTDYVVLLQDICNIADKNGKKCPKFTAF